MILLIHPHPIHIYISSSPAGACGNLFFPLSQEIDCPSVQCFLFYFKAYKSKQTSYFVRIPS